MKKLIYVLILTFIFSCNSNKTRVLQMEYVGVHCPLEKVTRVYLNDSIFIDRTITDLSDTIIARLDTFKVINKRWFIKKCGDFKVYFDSEGFEKGDTILIYNNICRPLLKVIPQKKILVDGKTLYEYKIEEQHYNYFAPTILFDPNIGDVKINAPLLKCEESVLKIISDQYLSQKALDKIGIKHYKK